MLLLKTVTWQHSGSGISDKLSQEQRDKADEMNKLTFLPAGFLALTAAAVGAIWWWLGHPVEMPQATPGAGTKFDCVSYAPFRGAQDPLTPDTKVEPWQIDEDLTRLSRLTNCVRTYSIEHGLDKIPE